MISWRNYITITLTVLILFFLFQFTGVMKERLNDYGQNEYGRMTKTSLTDEDVVTTAVREDTPYIVYIGDKKSDIGNVVTWWCTYSKRGMVSFPSCGGWMQSNYKQPEAAVIDGRRIYDYKEAQMLAELAESGIDMIFAALPDAAVIYEYDDLRNLLGINHVIQEDVRVDGMHLFGGFLLGGEEIYDGREAEETDKSWNFPWYVTGEGTKTYLMGTLPDEVFYPSLPQEVLADYANMTAEARKNALLPAIIWRHGMNDAKIFCVNGSYLSKMSGIGILDAMMAELHSYEVYPVVNARVLVTANYPAFAEENEYEMKRRYSQSMRNVHREIVWSSLAAVSAKTNAKLTCMMTPEYRYDDGIKPHEEDVPYYLKLLKEKQGEAGLTTSVVSGSSASEKLKKDSDFFMETAPEYAFLSLYAGDVSEIEQVIADEAMPHLRTVTAPKDPNNRKPPVSYADEAVTMQYATSDVFHYTPEERLGMKSMATALGYSNLVVDLLPIGYPSGEEESWEKMARKIMPHITDYWKPFRKFDPVTLSESDARIRRFLALDYTDERQRDQIRIQTEHREGEVYFILRTGEEEVSGMEGGTYQKLEEGAYLLCAQEDEMTVTVKPKKDRYYHRKRQGMGS